MGETTRRRKDKERAYDIETPTKFNRYGRASPANKIK